MPGRARCASAVSRLRRSGFSQPLLLCSLLLRIDRVRGLLEEFFLQPGAYLVGLDGSDRAGNGVGTDLLKSCSTSGRGTGSIALVVVGESRIPPNTRINVGRQVEPLLVGTRLRAGAFRMSELGPGRHDTGDLRFARVTVDARF